MNDQQRAAMQMALENFFKLYNKVMAAGNLGHQWTGLQLADDCRESIRAMGEALAQPQGERAAWVRINWVGECDFYSERLWQLDSGDYDLYLAPPVVPQVVTEGNASEVCSTDTGEPVAWAYFKDGKITAVEVGKPADAYSLSGDKPTPLYTISPSVEAAIEATKEKAAKVADELYANARADEISESIRSIK